MTVKTAEILAEIFIFHFFSVSLQKNNAKTAMNDALKINKQEKSFDAGKTFRKIKEKISHDLFGKNFEQIIACLKANSLKLQQQ